LREKSLKALSNKVFRFIQQALGGHKTGGYEKGPPLKDSQAADGVARIKTSLVV
jgi:hypothetical protein